MKVDRVRPLALPGYLLVGFMLVVPVLDIWVISLPAEWTSPLWRFGFVGTLTRVMETQAVGLLLLVFLAGALGHRRTLRAVSVVAMTLAVVMLLAWGLFSLDTMEARPGLNPDLAGAFDRVIALGMMKILISIVILGGFGYVSRGLSRRMPQARADDRTKDILVRR